MSFRAVEVQFGPLSFEESHRLARIFDENRDSRGFVAYDVAWRQLERTGDGLARNVLQEIWNRSDLDRDGRLSLREFVFAMHLAERVRNGQRVPPQVRPEDQIQLVRTVERLVHMSENGRRPDDFSTANTNASNYFGYDAGGDMVTQDKLGPLASIFEAAAIHGSGDLDQYSAQVLQGRQELEQQLVQRRELQEQLTGVRKSSSDLHDEQCRVDTELAAARRRISHLEEELEFLKGEVGIAEGDLDLLREAGFKHSGGDTTDFLSRVQGEQENWEKDKAAVDDKLTEIEEVAKMKHNIREAQQTLLEQQRQIEHDRNLLLTAIESEYGKLHKMRAERLQMWDERNRLEKELQEYTQTDGSQNTHPAGNRIQPGVDRGVRN